MVPMNKNRLIVLSIVLSFVALVWYTVHDLHPLENPNVWPMAYSPGALSKAHAFLSHQCTACHVPVKGVATVGCVTCHSDNEKLLKRQPTAFHAHIRSCKECHREHQGGDNPPLLMDHEALAKLGVRGEMMTELGENPGNLKLWRKSKAEETKVTRINPHEPAVVGQLSCIACHANQDKHRGFFGTSCLSCHTTQSWRIAGYRHPSPNNRDCAQCHQPPPSHSMGHFEMVSKKFAGQEHAQVNQCFLCHRTTSWNDIQGVGWYKHH